jgi:hypothetical protein
MRIRRPLLLFFFVIVGHAAAFDVVLMDDPAVHLVFDRKYEVLKIAHKDGTPLQGQLLYMMLPEDQQSSVTFGIGNGFYKKTEKTIAEMYEGAKVTKVDALIGGIKAQWWHYRDSHHLYSTCDLTVSYRKGKSLSIIIDLVANSPERLASLEDSFSKIQIVENPPKKLPEPTSKNSKHLGQNNTGNELSFCSISM